LPLGPRQAILAVPEKRFQASHAAISPSIRTWTVSAHEASHILHFEAHRMTFQRVPVSIQRTSCNILETLTNLLYLAEMEADDPQKVRVYLSLSQERVQAMVQLLTGKEGGGKEQPSVGGGSLRM